MPPELKAEVNVMPKVIQGDLESLPPQVREFIESNAKLCQPESIHICDGSEEENKKILDIMVEQGMIKKLSKYENWWVAEKGVKECLRIAKCILCAVYI